MGKKSAVFVCTTGRSGTVYLTQLFQRCVEKGVKVYHEEARTGQLVDLCGPKGIVMTGRVFTSLFADQLPELFSSMSIKLIVLVRSLVDVSTSWVRFLVRNPLKHRYFYEKLPDWWGEYRPIKWNKDWTPLQIATWHWFQTYIRTMEVTKGQQVKYLCFYDLNNLGIMEDVLSWSGCSKSCSSDVLAKCKSIGTAHGTQGEGSLYHYAGELEGWVNSLSGKELKLVRKTSQWIENIFTGRNLLPEEILCS